MGNPAGQGAGFAGAWSGNDQQRAFFVSCGL